MLGILRRAHHAEQQVQIDSARPVAIELRAHRLAFGAVEQRRVTAGERRAERRAALALLHFRDATHQQVVGQLPFPAHVEPRGPVQRMAIRTHLHMPRGSIELRPNPNQPVIRSSPVPDHENAELLGEVLIVGVEPERLIGDNQGKRLSDAGKARSTIGPVGHPLDLGEPVRAVSRIGLSDLAAEVPETLQLLGSVLVVGADCLQCDHRLSLVRERQRRPLILIQGAVQGTPTLFINGKRVNNTTDFDEISRAIDSALGA